MKILCKFLKKFYMYLDNNINNIIWIFHYERKVLIVWFCNKYKLYQKLLSSQDKKKLKLIQTIYKCFSDSSKHEGCQYCILKYLYIYIQQILRIDHKIENRTNTVFSPFLLVFFSFLARKGSKVLRRDFLAKSTSIYRDD